MRGSAVPVVDGLVVVVRGVQALGEIAARAGAGVDVSPGEESLERGAVGGQAGGLREHGRLPGDAEPGQVFEHRRDEFGAGALRVEVFVAEEERAVVLACAGEGGEKRGRVAEMKQAGGGRREASNAGRAHAFDDSEQRVGRLVAHACWG